MSTIDLTQVSGLRAVDAEGNDLGPVSLQDLTDSITIQVLQTISMRQQAATLEEPALLSASAQSAGSDTYENQLPEQTDLKWARALDASGNPILISKESLAVGGLLKINSSWIRARGIANATQIDNLIEAGTYALGEAIEPMRDYGVLIVGEAGDNTGYVVQALFGSNGFYYRIKTNNNNFSGTEWNYGGRKD